MSLKRESGNRGEPERLHGTASNLHAVDAEVSAADVDLDSLREPAPADDRIVKLPSEYDQYPERKGDNEPHRRALPGRPMAIGLLVLLAATTAGYLYWDHARRFVSTDDAFIAARAFPIAAKVSGYITAVPVTDNQHVNVGDVIAQIDDRDYHVALDQAQAQVENAAANIENIDALASVQEAQITANQAQVEQAQATLVFAEQQAERYQVLA